MYQGNYLAEAISQASDGRHEALFLEHGITGDTLTYGAF